MPLIHTHSAIAGLYPFLALAWTLLAIILAYGTAAELIRPSYLLLALLLSLQTITLVLGWPHG